MVDFHIRKVNAALLELQDSDGASIPLGSIAKVEGEEDKPVGYDGEAYVVGLNRPIGWPSFCRTGRNVPWNSPNQAGEGRYPRYRPPALPMTHFGALAAMIFLAALTPAPAYAGGAICNLSSTPLVFGAYVPSSNSPSDFTSTIVLTCTASGAAPVAVRGTITLSWHGRSSADGWSAPDAGTSSISILPGRRSGGMAAAAARFPFRAWQARPRRSDKPLLSTGASWRGNPG
ncbi:MAG: hypothetical protein WDN69_26150 [Aliidongia sp.]